MRRDLGVAISLATLSTVRIWLPIWNECYERSYMMKSVVTGAYVAGSLLALITLAAGIFAAARVLRRFRGSSARVIGELAIIASLFIPLNAFRTIFGGGHYALSRYAISTFYNDWPAVALTGGAVLAYGFWRVRQGLARFCYAALLIMLPLFPINLFHLMWSETNGHLELPVVLAGPAGNPPAKIRVVWVLFDEWDYGLTFADRPLTLHLPELDSLKSTSLFATNVSSPSWQTRVSVPALTTGRLLKNVAETGRGDARLTPLGDGPEARWSKTPTVFSDARALGFNTSIVGSYLPYCRVLGGVLSTCWWSEAPNLVTSTGSSVASIAMSQLRSVFETQNFSPFGAAVLSTGYVEMFGDVWSHAEATLRRQETGLVYLHFPIPHPPTIYDRATGVLADRSAGARGYLDNLALVDQTVKRLREVMIANGQWVHTTLLLTSDHWYREASLLHDRNDLRVPFILKLAGDETPASVPIAFNNILTRELIMRVLRQEIQTNAQAALWLGANAEISAFGPTSSNRSGSIGTQ